MLTSIYSLACFAQGGQILGRPGKGLSGLLYASFMAIFKPTQHKNRLGELQPDVVGLIGLSL